MQDRAKRNTGNILFVLGVLIALALAALTAWASFEGLSYFATGAGYDPFDGLHCPIMISPTETGIVEADFINATDQAQQPYYEVEISGVAAARQLENQITLAPHTTQQVSWTVSAADVDLSPFVFVKMDVLPMAEYSTREATCGIIVANILGMKGGTAMSVAVALALLCMLLGLVLPAWGLTPGEAARFDSEASGNYRRATQALGLVAAFALLAGLMAWWLVATILIAISLLLLTMVVPMMVLSARAAA